ncbi:hypothetical protein HZS_1801 [Henneguya salminicola]|nr:hypothetical protein HZS_1801 [Henneguya salminicola]
MWYYNIFQSQLFRHGLRTPLWLYNNTPCSTDTYSDGLGALTNDGIKSSYFLGKALRNRYTLSHPFSLLSQSYKPDEVYAMSSGVDRCIQSGMAVTAGLFPPQSTKREWNPNMNWYPVPLHSSNPQDDIYFRARSTDCTLLDQKFEEIYQKSEIKKFAIEHQKLSQILKKYTGSEITYKQFNKLYQTLHIQKIDSGLDDGFCKHYPVWASDDLMSNLREAIIQYQNIVYNITNNDMKKLLGGKKVSVIKGPLLGLILQRLLSIKDENSTESKKLYLYSAHDTTLMYFLQSLSLAYFEVYSFSSAIFLELYKAEDKFFLSILFKQGRGYSDDLIELKIPFCTSSCDLNIFEQHIMEIISTDRKKECISSP